jgi:hypothetical protein
MSSIRTEIFGGMLPKIDVEALPDRAAQFAQNLKMTSGALEPWRLPAPVAGVTLTGATAIKTLYRYGKDTASRVNYWFQFTGDVNIVKGPIVTDTEERTYWTDGTYPKKTKANIAGLTAGVGILPGSLRMGIPAPTPTPTATVSGTAVDVSSAPFTSTYVINYLTSWGEPSAPGPASNIVTWRVGQTVTISCPGALSGAYDVTQIQLYRSNTGTARSTFQFLATKAVASVSHSDTALAASLGEVCPSFDWNPPSDGMVGLTDMGNGLLAGFEKNTVYFCEPNVPYAWPAKYDFSISAPIVGMSLFGQTLVVGTTDGLTLITGTDPSSMSSETPTGSQACVSKRSMVQMLGGVVYACPDGLFMVGPGIARNLTANLLSRDEWQSYVPSSIDGYTIDDRYYAFYDNGTTKACLIFSLGEDPGMVMCDQYATAGYLEDRLDSLFLVKYAASVNTLNEWNTGGNMTVSWRSKDYRYHSGVCMSCAKVSAVSYPVTFKLYADGALKWTQTVTDQFAFRLPDQRNYVISYQIDATSKVKAVRVATSFKELGDGGG